MGVKTSEEAPRGVGRFTRLSLGVQVLLLALLGILVAVFAIAIFDRGSLRARIDLTADGINSLDEKTLELLRGLPGQATVDVFYRPSSQAALRPVDEAAGRLLEMLADAQDSVPDRLEVIEHDLLADLARVEARLGELDVDPTTLYTSTPYGQVLAAVAVSRGERRTVFRLVPEAAEIDWGDPYRREAPRLVTWRGEEALGEALGKISTDQVPKIAFAIGQGELRLNQNDPQGYALTRLRAELLAEGFEVVEWSPARDGPVFEDVDALALVGSEEPFSESGRLAIDDYLARGGRVLLALPLRLPEGEGDLERLALRYGMRLIRGIVCAPVVDPRSGLLGDGTPECASLRIPGKDTSSSHPVTRPLWERDRSLFARFTRSFERGRGPEGISPSDLVSSPADSWRDLPGANGQPDFRYEAGSEERGRVRLAMAIEFPGTTALGGVKGRLIGLPTPSFLDDRLFEYNRDFAINAFNWLCDRDFRVRVSPRDPLQSKLDVERNPAVTRALRLLAYLPPAVCLLIGAALFLRRRS